MYVPPAFREDRLDVLHALMREHSFATLVTGGEGGLQATHLPLLLDSDPGPFGALRGHVARANDHWQALEAGAEAMVLFQGPHAYISPAWYTTEPSVPTWNYAAVHAYGTPRFLDGPELRELLAGLVHAYESPRPEPWPYHLPEEYVDRMCRAIVGFEILITRLEGKLKLSQNRSPADRAGAVAGLRTTGDPASLATAELMLAAHTERMP